VGKAGGDGGGMWRAVGRWMGGREDGKKKKNGRADGGGYVADWQEGQAATNRGMLIT